MNDRIPQPPGPAPDLIGYELTIGQALADAIAWRRQGTGGEEFIGLYKAAAKALGIPGDVSQGPGEWHPDASEVTP